LSYGGKDTAPGFEPGSFLLNCQLNYPSMIVQD